MKMMLLLLACSAALISNVEARTRHILHQANKANAAKGKADLERLNATLVMLPQEMKDRFAHKRKSVLDALNATRKTLPQEVKESFVEDIGNLTRAPHKCKAEFFCKVEAILKMMKPKGKDLIKLTKTLTVLNNDNKGKVKEREPMDDQIEFQKLLTLLEECIQYCNVYVQECLGLQTFYNV